MGAHDGIHVVVANEPRSYREALAGALARKRPADRVVASDPGSLPELEGTVVVCSEVTPDVARQAGGWVLLRPDGGVAVSSVSDAEAVARRSGLQAVLDAVDRVANSLAHTR
jgi:hypothetical protein